MSNKIYRDFLGDSAEDYPKLTFGNVVFPNPTLNMSPEEKAEFEEFKEHAKRQMHIFIPPEPERLIPKYIIKYFMNRRNRVPYCGECAFFTAECSDGFGYCEVTERGCACNNQCDLDHTKMKPKQIAKALHYIQKWRRGANIAMPSPYVIGRVLDASIYQLRKQEREKREAIEEQRKLAEEMKIRRGDFVMINGVCGEIYGHIERIKQMGQNCLVEFMERRKGHVERYIVPEEDIKLLLGVR